MTPLRYSVGELMTYLCSVPLNPLRSGAQELVANPQRMHAAVEGVLPPQRSGRLLWRLERDRHALTLLVLSPELPTLDHLVEQAGWPGAAGGAPKVADVAPLLAQIAIGRRFAFRARLNPVQNVPREGQRAIRRGHRTLGHQLAWFTERSTGTNDAWGFCVGGDAESAQVQVVERNRLRFTRERGSRDVVIETATFEGILQVTDSTRFREALRGGLGSAKAYGCGLITLSPEIT